MSRLQIPRQTSAFIATYEPNEGEIFFDTTNDELKADAGGVTAGKALAWKDGSNLTASASIVTAIGGDTLSLASWFKGMARGTTIPTDGYFYFTNRSTNGNTADPLRMRHRLFLGDGCDDDGSTGGLGQQTWLASEFDNYFARSAQLLSISPSGGAGGVFATRTSDCFDGNQVWAQSQSILIGAKRGYQSGLYTAASAGTTGATPPTHTTGTVSDGGVDWTFTYSRLRTPMAIAALTYNDAADKGAAWTAYLEAVRGPGAGFTTALEMNIQNVGSNVDIAPYAMFPTGATPLLWLACQQNVYGPAATAPASAAIGIIGRSGEANYKFNKGIVFHSESLTRTSDIGTAMEMAVGHALRWQRSNAVLAARVYSIIDLAGTIQQSLVFTDTGTQIQAGGLIVANFVGQVSHVNRVTLTSGTTGNPFTASIAGSDTNIRFFLEGQAAADIVAHRNDSSTNTAPTVLTARRSSTGTPATGIGAALAFEVETAASNYEIGALIEAVTTDVTSASEDFDIVFKRMVAGAAAAEVARFTSDNKVILQSGVIIDWNAGDVTLTHASNVLTFGGATSGYFFQNGRLDVSASDIRAASAQAIPAGGSQTIALKATSTANYGMFFGSGAPTVSAAKGSLYLRSDGAGPNSRAYINFDGATSYVPVLTGGVQALSGAGAIDVTNLNTKWTTTGAGNAGTLADGVEGQDKVIVHVVDGGSGVLTPTNLANGTTITFTNVGAAAVLKFLGTEWHVISLYGAVLA